MFTRFARSAAEGDVDGAQRTVLMVPADRSLVVHGPTVTDGQ
ncbi:hypothetical protein [Rhodococcus maanshanensis]|nr:hypothetical protein [Rhodococcus maanshanensis]